MPAQWELDAKYTLHASNVEVLMSPKSYKYVWTTFAIAALVLFILWEPDAFRGVARTGVRLIVLGIAAALAYQSFDAFRSSIKGVQPVASAPDSDPKGISSRLAGLGWGIVSGLMSIGAATWALGLWGSFP
jgi:hypothetical protein